MRHAGRRQEVSTRGPAPLGAGLRCYVPNSARTASDSAGHASLAHGVEVTAAEHGAGHAGGRVDPEERPAAAEVAEGGRGVAPPRPVGPLGAPHLDAEPPVQRVLAVEAGQAAGQPGERHRGGLVQGRLGDDRRRHQLAGQAHEVVERARQAGGRRALEIRAGHAEGVQDGLGQVGAERHARPLGDQPPEQLEAGVGVDAPAAGRGQHRLAVVRQAGGVGQQVAHGRARRAGGLVERHGLLLHRDQHGQGGADLRHRGPVAGQGRVAPGRHHAAAGAHDRGPGVGRVPAVELVEGGQTTVPRWSSICSTTSPSHDVRPPLMKS